MSEKNYTAEEAAKELLDRAADALADALTKNEYLAKAMKAKTVMMDDKGPGNIPLKGWKYGKRTVGSWAGPNPSGSVTDEMRSLDLKTGDVKMHGPKGKIPGDMDKVSPENQNTAQMAEVKLPDQPKPPSANQKMIIKPPLKLKKFVDSSLAKRAMRMKG